MWLFKVLIFFAVILVESIKSEISCIEKPGNRVYFCSDVASFGGQEIQNVCSQIDPNYITIEANNTPIINKSILNYCNPYNFTMTNGSLQDVSLQTFENFRVLKQLDLSGNKIRKLSNGLFIVNNIQSRKEISIDLSRNQINIIEDGAFSFSTEFKRYKINLSHNKIENLNLSSIMAADFNDVDSSFNKIGRIRGTGSQFFKASLEFGHNHLKTLDFSVFNNSEINHLGLSYNNLTNLICAGIINTKIRDLNVAHNSLTTLTETALPIVNHSLDLSQNKLKSIHVKTFSHLHDLQILNLSNNHLQNLLCSVFHNLDQLKILDLSNNQLISKDLQTVYGLNSLITFYFHNNQINQIDIKSFPYSILEMSFYGNQLSGHSCHELHEFIKVAAIYKKIIIIKGPQVNEEHVHGIACQSSDEGNNQEGVPDMNRTNGNESGNIGKVLVNLTAALENLSIRTQKNENSNLEQKISVQLTLLSIMIFFILLIFFVFLIIFILLKSNNLKKICFKKNRNQNQGEHSYQRQIISTEQELIEM